MPSPEQPLPTKGVVYLSLQRLASYIPFCADFGPFNLGVMHRACEVIKDLLRTPRLAHAKIVCFTSTETADITNAMFLLGAFLVVHLDVTPEQAWICFREYASMPYRDATWSSSSFDLTLQHCWQGIARALQAQLYCPENFDMRQYFFYDHPRNGDMHEVVAGKFFAFKGPTDKQQRHYTRRPGDYLDVFHAKGIKDVVRLNEEHYDAATFTSAGFSHHDLVFPDCTTPPDAIADRFLRLAEQTSSPMAVHCLAGLGRTGTLIGLYMMKHIKFNAEECIAWLRIVRPGSIIGPQQQYLKDQEKRMHALGRSGASGLGLDSRADGSVCTNVPRSSRESSGACSADLAQQVARGMGLRDQAKRRKSRQSHNGDMGLSACPGSVPFEPAPTLQGKTAVHTRPYTGRAERERGGGEREEREREQERTKTTPGDLRMGVAMVKCRDVAGDWAIYLRNGHCRSLLTELLSTGAR